VSKDITIEIKTAEESAMDAVRAWGWAERGQATEDQVGRLYFQRLDTLLSVLSTHRLDLPWYILKQLTAEMPG
jgi:hypothetical protein